MSNKDSSPAPSWGSPAQGLAWGSPAQGNNTPKNYSPNPQLNTPSLSRHSSPSFHSRSGNGHSENSRSNNNNFLGVRKQFSTPPNFSPRPLFQSSPAHMMPRDNTSRHRFPQQNRNSFGRGMPSHGGGSPYSHQKAQFSQRNSFSRGDSMSNPGGSSRIDDYIHPSMLEDPWRDLPATPMQILY